MKMAATTSMLLIVLAVMVAPVYLQTACAGGNTTASSGNFTLTVNPATYIANTTYTVTVNGTGNATNVHFQATDAGSNVTAGLWTTDNGMIKCVNSSDIYSNTTGPPFVANWTSSVNGTSATIRAFIIESVNVTYLIVKYLQIETTTSTPTVNTTANTTVNATVNTTVNATVTTTGTTTVTATTVKATANSASSSSWILIALLQSAYMVVKNRVTC